MDAPQFQMPPLQPGYAALLAQSKQQDTDASLAGARQEGDSLTARYGTLTSADSASLLARYGANLAMANAGTAAAPALPKPQGFA